MTFSQRNKLDLRIAKYEKIEFLDLILQIFKKRLKSFWLLRLDS